MLARSSGEPRRIDLAVEQPFRLGALRVIPSLRQVGRDGRSRTLEPRVMQVLVALARAEGHILSRDMLIDCCWDGRIVGDNSINRVISLLRQLASETGAFEIETITKVGYRLKLNGRPAHPTAEFSGGTPHRRAAIAMLGAAAVASAAWMAAPDILSSDRRKARRLYEAGREIERQSDRQQLGQAVAYFARATQADPQFADAWGALARATLRVSETDEKSATELAPRVRATAQRALSLDPGNADALLALVLIRPIYRHWEATERETRQTLARKPELAMLQERLGLCLANTGRLREAQRVFAMVAAREPLVPLHQLSLAWTLWQTGDVRRAGQIYDRAMESWPNNPWVWLRRFMFLSLTGRPEAALAMTGPDAARNLAGGPLPIDIGVACARALASRGAADTEKAVAEIVAARGRGDIASFISIPYLVPLGAVDLAFEQAYGYYLGRRDPATGERQPLPAMAERWTDLLFAAHTAALRADPRFAKLTEAIGLEEHWRSTGATPDYRRA